MTVLQVHRLESFARKHRDAARPLAAWLAVTRAASWRSIVDVRKTYPHADAVKAASGRTLTVFNVGGNKYRLITGVDYPTQVANVWRVLTHPEYDDGSWKGSL